jgi:hypothetical protein
MYAGLCHIMNCLHLLVKPTLDGSSRDIVSRQTLNSIEYLKRLPTNLNRVHDILEWRVSSPTVSAVLYWG